MGKLTHIKMSTSGLKNDAFIQNYYDILSSKIINEKDPEINFAADNIKSLTETLQGLSGQRLSVRDSNMILDKIFEIKRIFTQKFEQELTFFVGALNTSSFKASVKNKHVQVSEKRREYEAMIRECENAYTLLLSDVNVNIQSFDKNLEQQINTTNYENFAAQHAENNQFPNAQSTKHTNSANQPTEKQTKAVESDKTQSTANINTNFSDIFDIDYSVFHKDDGRTL